MEAQTSDQTNRSMFDSYVTALDTLVTKLETAGEDGKTMEKEKKAYLVSSSFPIFFLLPTRESGHLWNTSV